MKEKGKKETRKREEKTRKSQGRDKKKERKRESLHTLCPWHERLRHAAGGAALSSLGCIQPLGAGVWTIGRRQKEREKQRIRERKKGEKRGQKQDTLMRTSLDNANPNSTPNTAPPMGRRSQRAAGGSTLSPNTSAMLANPVLSANTHSH